ncbi:MAG: hypothetical protein LPK19_11810, partial [Hymenobacteraceae bacterium]|nr:hypothetical protein [Hymenobacteraceae bacterium]MDX5396912.1 hypothetical protein [Hymenobacteraceae bacterium]MDX5512986.1 hypothetical protein [Hymenobacteraceae bacterium]
MKAATILVLTVLGLQCQAQDYLPPLSSDSLLIAENKITTAETDTTATVRKEKNYTPGSVTKKSPLLLSAVVINSTAAVATTGAWVASYTLMDERVKHYSQEHKNEVTGTISSALQPLGRAKYLVPAAGAMLAGGFILKDYHLKKAGIVTLASLQVNALATDALKRSFQRHRPSTTSAHDLFGGPGDANQYTSLPSSHTST